MATKRAKVRVYTVTHTGITFWTEPMSRTKAIQWAKARWGEFWGFARYTSITDNDQVRARHFDGRF